MKQKLPRTLRRSIVAALAIAPLCAYAADDCKNRGELDTNYCDEDNNLVAEAPKDKSKWKDPNTLVFAYTPIEDPAVYANLFKGFTEYLSTCTSKKVVYFTVQSNAAQIEAMRSGRLHVAGLASGETGFAVNLAGAVPFRDQGQQRRSADVSPSRGREERQHDQNDCRSERA
jgi:phosphonate transport system substrate-binding protein